MIDLLTEVKLDSREAKDIIKNIADSFWEPDAYTLEFNSIKLVYNEMLEKQVRNDISVVKHELQFPLETSSHAGCIMFYSKTKKTIQNARAAVLNSIIKGFTPQSF